MIFFLILKFEKIFFNIQSFFKNICKKMFSNFEIRIFENTSLYMV